MDGKRPTTGKGQAARPDTAWPEWLSVKGKVRLAPEVAALRRKLYQKAKQEKRYRFYTLYDRICRLDVMLAAWELVRRNDGAAGVDGMTIRDVENGPGAEAFCRQLCEELRTRRYRPQPVKRVYIPKPDGRKRPLGIPTVRDRVVQMAVLLVLEPVFEADFTDSSFGFRPQRSARQAVETVRTAVKQGYRAVYDADLKAYFDTIPHEKLMAAVHYRVTDGSVLKLIRMWLRAPVVEASEDGGAQRIWRPEKGTPQGGVLSPLLANIYLHWFEVMFYGRRGPGCWAKALLVRYADDFVILARSISERLVRWVQEVLEGRFGLEINREKTRVVDLSRPGASVDFLGFTFRYDRDLKGRPWRYLNVFPSKKAVKRARARVRELTAGSRCFVPVVRMIREVGRWLRSWGAYFKQVGYPAKAFRQVRSYAIYRLCRHLKRRSQRAFRPPKGRSLYAQIVHLAGGDLKALSCG